jgi:Flp pilus assembly protein TadG
MHDKNRKDASKIAAARGPILSDRRGGSAFEFALLLPLMMMMAFGTIQYAMLFYTYNAMTGAARYAVLSIARGDRSLAATETIARSMLPPWVAAGDYTVTITDAAPGNMVTAQISAVGSKAAIIPYAPMPAIITSGPLQFQKQ